MAIPASACAHACAYGCASGVDPAYSRAGVTNDNLEPNYVEALKEGTATAKENTATPATLEAWAAARTLTDFEPPSLSTLEWPRSQPSIRTS